MRSSPLTIIGSVGEIAEELHRRRERWGYSYFVLPSSEAVAFASVVAALAGS